MLVMVDGEGRGARAIVMIDGDRAIVVIGDASDGRW